MNMLFRTNPEKTIRKNAADKRASRAELIGRIADADAAITELRMAAEGAALVGAADDVLDAAESKTRAMVDRAATLRAALAQREAELAEIERELDELADKKLRSESAATLEKLAVEFETAAKVFDAAAAKMADCATRSAVLAFEAKGLEVFFGSVRVEIPIAITAAVASLRALAVQIESGGAPAALPQPEAPVVREPVVAPPPVTRVFATRAIKWKDASGARRLSPKFADVDLPPETAARALKSGAVTVMSDPRRRTLHGQSPGFPDESWCLDLDAEPGVVADKTGADRPEPIEHSAFTRVDRGPGFVVKIPREVA